MNWVASTLFDWLQSVSLSPSWITHIKKNSVRFLSGQTLFVHWFFTANFENNDIFFEIEKSKYSLTDSEKGTLVSGTNGGSVADVKVVVNSTPIDLKRSMSR